MRGRPARAGNWINIFVRFNMLAYKVDWDISKHVAKINQIIFYTFETFSNKSITALTINTVDRGIGEFPI